MHTSERQTPATILKDVFGYREWRPPQREIIENVLAGRDTLAILPTGAGKSLCYQIPALLFPGLTVVVSPLISLMKDQWEQLSAAGVTAVVLNSSLTESQYRAGVRQVIERRARLLYVAPETLLLTRTRDLLARVSVAALVIDEAHCISEWGHDFRPEYRRLVTVRQQFPRAVCLALTATATPRVQQDIMDCLHFSAAARFISSFDRANLFLEIQYRRPGIEQAVEFISRFRDQAGIVYCLTRNQVDRLSAGLAARHFSVRPYHAGLAAELRQAYQEAFIRDEVQIMVATVAFGMGINKPDVRFILHHHLPLDVEGYYQQIGRAGRDGLPAHCLLLHNRGDVAMARMLIGKKESPEREVAEQHLDAIQRLVEGQGCRRIPLLAYFGETYGREHCDGCDNCRRQGEAIVDDVPESPGSPWARARRGSPLSPPPAADERTVDHGLFEALRRLRKSLADEGGIPAYAVFSDRSLLDMAARMPLTKGQFRTIHGVGKAKMYSFASQFLRTIREYCRENDIVPAYRALTGEDPDDPSC